MRMMLALFLALALAPLGHAVSRPAQQPPPGPTERIPNKDALNAFPRWLQYTLVRVNSITSVAIDSRGTTHLAGQDDITSFRIVHFTDAMAGRDKSGFSKNPEVIDQVPADFNHTLGNADLWIHSDDTLHFAYEHFFKQDPPPPPNEIFHNRTEIYYVRKDGQNGVAAPVKLTEAQPDYHFSNPQVQVDSAGIAHILCRREFVGTGPQIPPSLHYILFNPAQPVSPGTNPQVIEIPGPVPSSERHRFVLDTQNNPHLVWQEIGQIVPPFVQADRLVFYMKGMYSAGSVTWGASQNVAGGGSNWGPDVDVDANNLPHVVWQRRLTPDTLSQDRVFYRFSPPANPEVQVSTQNVFSNAAVRVALDSRGQPHVLWAGLNYAARVKNPDPGQLDPTWRRQEEVFVPEGDAGSMGEPREIALSRNDVIHVIDGSSYTRTMDYGVGARDPAALAGVLPGGAVNVTNGNLLFRLPLFSTRGVGPTQSCVLTYNSLDQSTGSMLSGGWRLNYEVALIDHEGTPARYTVFLGDGRPIHFKFDSALGYAIAEQEFAYFDKLEKIASPAEYRLTSKFGDVAKFNADGQLVEIRDKADRFLDLTWDLAQEGRLTTITDMKGPGGTSRPTMLEYEPVASANKLYGRRLQTITDPKQSVYTFGYNGAALETVEFTSGLSSPTWKFTYYTENDADAKKRIGLPEKISPPRGTAGSYGWPCKYLQDNRLLETMNPDDVALSFQYKEDGAVSAPRETRITNRRNFTTKYVYESKRALVLEIHDPTVLPSPPAGFSFVKREFDTFGNLVRVTDRWGEITDYDIFTTPESGVPAHVKDNLKEVRKPSPTGPQTVVKYSEYTPLCRPRTKVTFATPPGGAPGPFADKERETKYKYDPLGQVTEILHPLVRRPDLEVQDPVTTSYTYDGPRKQLTRVTNEEGRSTFYSQFDGRGLAERVLREGGTQQEMLRYDVMGNLEGHRMPTGAAGNLAPNEIVYARDGMHRLTSVQDAAGQTTSYVYDPDSNQTEVRTPPLGVATPTITSYDHRGFVDGGSGPDGGWSQTVDANGNVLTHQNPRQGNTTSQYDALDRVTESIGPAVTTTHVQDGFGAGHFSTVTVGGRTTRTEYDNRGRAIKVVAPDAQTVSENFYDEQDQLIASQVKKGGLQTCTVTFRDSRDRVYLTRVQNGEYGGTVSEKADTWTLLNKAGSVVRTVDPLGDVNGGLAHTVTYERDSRERVRLVVDGFNQTVAFYDYGDDDMVSEVHVPNPATKGASLVLWERRTYTKRKELMRSENQNQNGVDIQYGNLPGQVTEVSNALGHKTVTTYHDGDQRPKDVIVASGVQGVESRSSHTWVNGLLENTTVWNPTPGQEGYTSTYVRAYDTAYRQIGFTSPGPVPPEAYAYTPSGDLDTITAGSRTTQLFHNALGQNHQTQISSSAFPMVTLQRTFDGLGLTTSVSDGNRAHGMDYLTWRAAPFQETLSAGGMQLGATQNHVVDLAGNPISFTDSHARTHAMPVDANNRPTAVAFDGNSVCSLAYTPGGLLDTVTLWNESGQAIATTTQEYDILGRRNRARTAAQTGSRILADYVWTYTVLDQIETITVGHLGISVAFTYDEAGRLKTEILTGNAAGCPPYTNQIDPDGSGTESDPPSPEARATPQGLVSVPSRTVEYDWDPAGNRRWHKINGQQTTFEYNAASQLLHEFWPAGKTVDHVYDEWGNETFRTTTEPALNKITNETYAYGYQNKLSFYQRSVTNTITQVTQTEAEFEYHFWPTGERAEKINLQATSSDVYFPHAGEVATEVDGQTLALKNTFAGMGLASVCTRIAGPSGPGQPRRHLLGDQVGTVGITLDDAAVTQDTTVKDAFGVDVIQANAEPYGGLAQMRQDLESGLHFTPFRMYDPRVGRFTQTDPIIENRPSKHYGYASNDPVRMLDPVGLQEGPSSALEQERRLNPDIYGGKGSITLKADPDAPVEDEELYIMVVGPRTVSDQDSVTLTQKTLTSRAGEQVSLTTKFIWPWSEPGKEIVATRFPEVFETVVGDPKNPLTWLQFLPLGKLAALGKSIRAESRVSGALASAANTADEVINAANVGQKTGRAVKDYGYLQRLWQGIKHRDLIAQLKEGDVIMLPGSASAKTMAQITIATGREVALLRVQGVRVLRLGTEATTYVADAQKIIAHTHPNAILEFSIKPVTLPGGKAGFGGDLGALWRRGQHSSVLISPSGEAVRPIAMPGKYRGQ